MLRFIHCADLHLDMPFSGLRQVSPEAAERLYRAPFEAWTNIVDLALMEKVDFVVIAGDVFNAQEKSLYAQLRFREQLERLRDGGISCYYACGNHDPLGDSSSCVSLPDNCLRFPSDKVGRFLFEKDGVAAAWIYGISFERRIEFGNLALRFRRDDDMTLPAIAVLHCNAGVAAHQPYAPCVKDDLRAALMDYWALGHVHSFTVMDKASPAIVYPGCSQGGSPREPGAHGCCLVGMDGRNEVNVEFRAVDAVRFRELDVPVGSCDDMGDVMSTVFAALEDCRDAGDGDRALVLRLLLSGRSRLDRELREPGNLNTILDEARSLMRTRGGFVWIDAIVAVTRGDHDLDELKLNNDFIAELIAIYEETGTSGGIPGVVAADWERLRSRYGTLLDIPGDDELSAILSGALDITLDHIGGGND